MKLIYYVNYTKSMIKPVFPHNFFLYFSNKNLEEGDKMLTFFRRVIFLVQLMSSESYMFAKEQEIPKKEPSWWEKLYYKFTTYKLS